jgi:hypothetical protein
MSAIKDRQEEEKGREEKRRRIIKNRYISISVKSFSSHILRSRTGMAHGGTIVVSHNI